MEEALAQLSQVIAESPDWLRYLLAGWGGLLIVTGWRWHRFWFSWAVTLAGGLWGLANAQRYQLSPVLAGVLAAIGCGCVALALTRLVVFVAGGWLCWQTVRLAASAWANGLVCFLVGGILSSLLFRLVVRLVTGGVGVWLLATALHWLSVRGEEMVWQIAWPDLQGKPLGWCWLGATLLAAMVQAFWDHTLDAWMARRQQKAKEKAAREKEAAAKAA